MIRDLIEHAAALISVGLFTAMVLLWAGIIETAIR
jgi:hypothetical protein